MNDLTVTHSRDTTERKQEERLQEYRFLSNMLDVYKKLYSKASRSKSHNISGTAMILAEYQRELDTINRIINTHYKGFK